jgi:hypothetical protein
VSQFGVWGFEWDDGASRRVDRMKLRIAVWAILGASVVGFWNLVLVRGVSPFVGARSVELGHSETVLV